MINHLYEKNLEIDNKIKEDIIVVVLSIYNYIYYYING